MLSKGHVVYEGISGHILTYDRECSLARWVVFLFFFSFSVKARHTGSASFLCSSCAGSSSQTPKDEGRGLAQPGEILGLKRPYDVMEGGISRGLPLRDSLSTASCEGKTVTLTEGFPQLRAQQQWPCLLEDLRQRSGS